MDIAQIILCRFGILKELEFERGIWSAAMDGEEKVEKLLKSGVCPSATDSSGYTALVCTANVYC